MFSKQPAIWLLLLSLVLILLSIPRFNRNDIGIQSLTTEGTGRLGDSAQYIAMTSYFRGETAAVGLRPPFTYRPLVPYLAAWLPLGAMTAINLINLAAMLIAIIVLYMTLTWLEIDFALSIIGCGLFVVSFPTFYYSTIGYVDPVLVSLLTVGLYAIFKNNWIFLVIVITVGVLVKETIIILILILAAYLVFSRTIFTKRGLVLPLMLFIFAAVYYIARTLIPVNPTVGWIPSFETLVFNVLRPRSWLSFLLSFGAPGFLSLFVFGFRRTHWFQERFAETATLITGFFISVLLFGFSMVSAYADGRFIWTSYPFSVPLAVIVLNETRRILLVGKSRV